MREFSSELVTLSNFTTSASLRETRRTRAVALRACGVALHLLKGVPESVSEGDCARSRSDVAAERAEAEAGSAEALADEKLGKGTFPAAIDPSLENPVQIVDNVAGIKPPAEPAPVHARSLAAA